MSTKSYAVTYATSSLEPFAIDRREPLPTDVVIDMLYWGVCHSDLHQVRNKWGNTLYPCVSGHEVVGRVVKVGFKVRKFKEGDVAAVGCMVDACRSCEECKRGLEQYCERVPIWTYNSKDPHRGSPTFGAIDVVVNCAGIMSLVRIADGDMEVFDKVIATNLRCVFIVLGQAARHVAPGRRIFAFSTSVVALVLPTYGSYFASKAGIEGLVRVLADELRGRNITVNAVAPGPVPTELFLAGKTEVQIDQMRKLPPLERIGQPEDTANVVSSGGGETV